jgi:hypothetical protein
MAMEPSNEVVPRWKALFIRAAGFGVGFAVIILTVGGAALWYINRPAPMRPWDRQAITAKFADLYGTSGNPMTMTFRYTVENHTDRDYQLPPSASLYKVLANGKGLEQDPTLRWDGATMIPAGQIVNIGIHIEYEYPGGSTEIDEHLTEFTDRRLGEIEGFAALDQLSRYDMRFPKPPPSAK